VRTSDASLRKRFLFGVGSRGDVAPKRLRRAADFNGFGESSNGDFRYPYDVLAAADYARTRAKGRPVHAFGLSFGSGWTMCAAEQQHPFTSIILEGAFTRIQDYYRGSSAASLLLGVLFQACSVPRSAKQEWFVRNAGHIRGFESAPEAYEHRVIKFLDAASAAAPANVSR
jgi:hypothetical protein